MIFIFRYQDIQLDKKLEQESKHIFSLPGSIDLRYYFFIVLISEHIKPLFYLV